MILSTWPTPFPQKEQLTVFLGFFSKARSLQNGVIQDGRHASPPSATWRLSLVSDSRDTLV